MCIVSNVGDFRKEPWKINPKPYRDYPDIWPDIVKYIPTTPADEASPVDVLKIIKAYEKAMDYDKENNEPDCHDPEKFQEFDALANRCLHFLQEELAKEDPAQEIIDNLTRMISSIHELKRLLT